MAASLRVEAGAVVVLRLYDVAYAVDLDAVERLGAAHAPAGVGRIKLTRAEPKAIDFGVPPVSIGLGTVELPLDGDRRRAVEASARVYDFGVVSVVLRAPAAGVSWDGFVDLATELDRAASAPAAAAVWTALLDRVRALIAPAVERPSPPGLEEDYLLTIVNRLDPPLEAEALLRDVDLAPILAGERRPLAPAARRDLLRHTFSYYPTDLAVLTWDHAFLLEPAGDTDVADVLEVANAQLLELRYYDDLLDGELPRMYDRVTEARQAFRALARRRYAGLARDLHTLVAEVTEITERVDNALKVTEDVYLARIYGTALEIFRVRSWAAAVDRKLAIIRDTYTTLYDDAATARAELLEATIVLLILLDILLVLFL